MNNEHRLGNAVFHSQTTLGDLGWSQIGTLHESRLSIIAGLLTPIRQGYP